MTLDKIKLGKLLGMLGSAHDGEVANAGRAADALVRGAGLTWPQLLGGTEQDRDGDFDCVIAHLDKLTQWEKSFIADIGARGRWPLSPKQQTAYDRIVRKARVWARAAA